MRLKERLLAAIDWMEPKLEAVHLFVLRTVQIWIADPLQFSGVSLPVQIIVARALILAGWIWATAFALLSRLRAIAAMDALLIAVSLYPLVYHDDLRSVRERAVWSGPMRYWGLLWLWLLSEKLVFEQTDGFLLVCLGSILLHYLTLCEPRPPAPDLQVSEVK